MVGIIRKKKVGKFIVRMIEGSRSDIIAPVGSVELTTNITPSNKNNIESWYNKIKTVNDIMKIQRGFN